jgi:hypothetical protein
MQILVSEIHGLHGVRESEVPPPAMAVVATAVLVVRQTTKMRKPCSMLCQIVTREEKNAAEATE